MKEILEQLGLEAVNDGTWFGAESRSDESAPLIESSNPATDELIASVRATTMAQYEDVIAQAQESFLMWRACRRRFAATPFANCQRAAQAQRRARQPRGAGEWQDQGRGRRRSSGDDRHRRLRGRPVTHAVWPHHALGAPAASHVRTVAPARSRRHDLGIQFPGRRLRLERLHRRDLRQRQHLEAVAQHGAVWRRRAEDHQRGARGHGSAARVLPDQRRHGHTNSPSSLSTTSAST